MNDVPRKKIFGQIQILNEMKNQIQNKKDNKSVLN